MEYGVACCKPPSIKKYMIFYSNLTLVSSNSFLKTEVYDNEILRDMLTFVVNAITLKKSSRNIHYTR